LNFESHVCIIVVFILFVEFVLELEIHFFTQFYFSVLLDLYVFLKVFLSLP